MAHFSVPRGVKGDLAVNLLTQSGGLLTDDTDWTDGTTTAQWPTMVVLDSGSNDVTAQWAFGITAETIADATHKHPDGTTGIWRRAVGRYRIRVEVDAGQTLGSYTLRVTADIGSGTVSEDHVINLVQSGDIIFGEGFGSIEVALVTQGISTSLTTAQLADLVTEASDWASAEVSSHGIDPLGPLFADGLPKAVKTAIIHYSRHLVTMYDAGSGGKPVEIQEGTERIKFAGRTGTALMSWEASALRQLTLWIDQNRPSAKPRLQVVESQSGDFLPYVSHVNETATYRQAGAV